MSLHPDLSILSSQNPAVKILNLFIRSLFLASLTWVLCRCSTAVQVTVTKLAVTLCVAEVPCGHENCKTSKFFCNVFFNISCNFFSKVLDVQQKIENKTKSSTIDIPKIQFIMYPRTSVPYYMSLTLTSIRSRTFKLSNKTHQFNWKQCSNAVYVLNTRQSFSKLGE